jgi:hypothetical protein
MDLLHKTYHQQILKHNKAKHYLSKNILPQEINKVKGKNPVQVKKKLKKAGTDLTNR